MTKEFSYPKDKINVLLLESIHPDAKTIFEKAGFHVTLSKDAMNEDELSEIISDIHILGIRSKTNLTPKVLEKANKLLSIGAYCIGTNQINLSSASHHGIAVFNAPYSNTRSVVELALGEIILLMRDVVRKNELLHRGSWDKSSKNSTEVRGKTLGIIGYGHIGSQLSVLAEAMGMRVIFYDISDKMPLGNATFYREVEEVLTQADVITLHIDGRSENAHWMNQEKFDLMKKGSIFLNLSRGHVVDYQALKKALDSGKIIGAGIDVYPNEPKSNQEPFVFELQAYPNVILTPHIGGSTEEAQHAIGEFVTSKLIQFINNGDTYGSVNLPQVQLPSQENNHRILHIHQNKPGILAQINQIIASHQVNITGQYLKTHDEIGYVIMDIESDYPDTFIKELKALVSTIKCRILY